MTLASVDPPVAAPLLAVSGLAAGYGGQPVVSGLDLRVSAGEVVALLGANGAGKSTTLLVLAGALAPQAGMIRRRDGGAPPGRTRRWRRRRTGGIALVTGRGELPMRRTVRRALRRAGCDQTAAVELFPELVGSLGRRVGQLDLDERRMLALVLATGRRPDVLLVDELSAGATPTATERLLAALRRLADRGTAVVVVEQFVRKALAVADTVYVLRHGRLAYQGSGEDARRSVAQLEAAYLAAG